MYIAKKYSWRDVIGLENIVLNPVLVVHLPVPRSACVSFVRIVKMNIQQKDTERSPLNFALENVWQLLGDFLCGKKNTLNGKVGLLAEHSQVEGLLRIEKERLDYAKGVVLLKICKDITLKVIKTILNPSRFCVYFAMQSNIQGYVIS